MEEKDLISDVFPELDDGKLSQLVQYASLLRSWNEKINLVSRKDIKNCISRHIIPCLAFARVANFFPGETILDIGTGGGLPGIPLAIACATAKFTLLDSIGKKIAAVNAMISELGLRNVETIISRAEEVSGKFDKIVARAVTNLPDFMKYAQKLLRPNGKIFYLKGGDCRDDLKLLKICKLHSISDLLGSEGIEDKIILEIFLNG
ncbi:MAG: 16S rRNA (guanine(527)-N(7))-methyltransferase RsmG [Puniceicoccales bacterium]|jgi:16S rRNA (guanine527-N7)-methyltransferase|nr:16S rRNA (guanine(527)-N(7))-methyltransferase RsmG [Puniceicoccales bacterium]